MYKSFYLKFFIIFIFILICVGVGYAEWKILSDEQETEGVLSGEDISQWRVYQNKKYGFELKYPNYFAVEEESSEIFVSIGPTSSSSFQAKELLTVEVIEPDGIFQFDGFIQKVLESSARLKNFSLRQQQKITLSGHTAYEIDFTGGIQVVPDQEYRHAEEPMRLLYIQNTPYIIAVFIPQSNELFSTIASTLTFSNYSGR